MGQVAVRTDLLAGSFAELHEGARVIDDEVRVHLKGEALDAVLAGEIRGILPIRNDFFIPLPVLHLGVFRRPAIGNPIRLGVLGGAAPTTGKNDDDFYLAALRAED